MYEPRLTPQQRAQVKSRAEHCCEYCLSHEPYSPDTFSIEHIIPVVKGGTNRTSNLANACQGCNNRKYTSIEGLDLVTGASVPLYHPRRDKWSEHFAWNEDFSLVIGLTPIGRATTVKLDLNRKGVVNLCKVLAPLGLHPIEYT